MTDDPYMDFLPEIYGPYGPYMYFYQNIWTVQSISDLLRGNRAEDFKIQNVDEKSKMFKYHYLQFPCVHRSKYNKEEI